MMCSTCSTKLKIAKTNQAVGSLKCCSTPAVTKWAWPAPQKRHHSKKNSKRQKEEHMQHMSKLWRPPTTRRELPASALSSLQSLGQLSAIHSEIFTFGGPSCVCPWNQPSKHVKNIHYDLGFWMAFRQVGCQRIGGLSGYALPAILPQPNTNEVANLPPTRQDLGTKWSNDPNTTQSSKWINSIISSWILFFHIKISNLSSQQMPGWQGNTKQPRLSLRKQHSHTDLIPWPLLNGHEVSEELCKRLRSKIQGLYFFSASQRGCHTSAWPFSIHRFASVSSAPNKAAEAKAWPDEKPQPDKKQDAIQHLRPKTNVGARSARHNMLRLLLAAAFLSIAVRVLQSQR